MQRIADRAPARASSTRVLSVLVLGVFALGMSSVARAADVTTVTATTADGTYGEDAVIAITVKFSAAVNVTSNSNAQRPKISLNSDAFALASYVFGTGTDTLTFHYAVQAGDEALDLNYSSTAALQLYGGDITFVAGGAQATLTLPDLTSPSSLGGAKNIKIDSSSPTVLNVSSTATNGSFKEGDVVAITVKFNEAVTVTTNGSPATLTLETGTTDAVVNYSSGSGTDTLTFNYTVAAGENATDLDYTSTTALVINGTTIKDSLGNNADLELPTVGSSTSLAGQKALVVDTTAPTVISVTSTAANATYGVGQVIPITVKFTEVVVVTSNATLTLETGTTDAVVNYGSGSGTDTLTFNYTVASGHAATDLDYVSTTSLAVGVGNSAVKDSVGNDAVLTLAAPGAAASLGGSKAIVINSLPTITQVQPVQGPAAGGTTVQIIGSNFGNITGVEFGASNAASTYVVISNTLISVLSPAGTAGAVDVIVKSAAGDGTKSNGFTYLAAPTIAANGVSPAKGAVSGGKTVTITGTGFTGATVVKFDGTPVSSFTVVNATTITAVTPAHAASTTAVNVTVTTAGGTATGVALYTYMAAPTVTSIDIVTGPTAGGQTVTVTGTNFDLVDADNTVKLGGVALTAVVSNSETEIVGVTGARGAGKVDLEVTTLGGTAKKVSAYQYVGPMTVTAVTPNKGDVAGGTAISITGTNFIGVTGVEVGNVAATDFVLVSATKITCTVPAGTAGDQNIDILAPSNNADAAGTFTYGNKPTVTTTTLPDGQIGTAYTATTISTTGTPTLTASGLPTGLKFATGTGEISGSPTKAGSFAVVITAKNDFGTATAVLTIKVLKANGATNNNPEIASQAYAFPNPATTNEKVTFSATATDADKDALSYVWDFNGEGKGSGSTSSFIFKTTGTKTVTLTVSDGDVDVTSTVTVEVGGLSVTSGTLKFNFAASSKDNLKLSGVLVGVKDFVPAGEQVSLTLGTTAYAMTLNSKGQANTDKTQTFSMTGKIDKTSGAYTTDTVKYSASLVNKNLFTVLEDSGFVNSTVAKPGAQITIPVFLAVNGKSFSADVVVNYTSTQGKAGVGTLKKK